MNGRVYDYSLGRFTGVDPLIQFPLNSQSLNPYSYLMNNPMSGTDPTGYAMGPCLGNSWACTKSHYMGGEDSYSGSGLGDMMKKLGIDGRQASFRPWLQNGSVSVGSLTQVKDKSGIDSASERANSTNAVGDEFASGAIQGTMMRAPQPHQTGALGDPDPENWEKGYEAATKANTLLQKAGFFERGFAESEMAGMKNKWRDIVYPISEEFKAEIGVKMYWQESTKLTYSGPAHSSGQFHTIAMDKNYIELERLSYSEEMHTHPYHERAVPNFSGDDYRRAEFNSIDSNVIGPTYRYHWSYDLYMQKRLFHMTMSLGRVIYE